MSTSREHNFAGTITSVVITLVVLLGAAWLVFNREYALDQLTVWQYQPNESIVQLARDSKMSERGVFYFYASKPELHQNQDVFNRACPRQEKTSAILGCYAARSIHIYDVQDERLEAVPAVTAAHEMLHAAWDRLTESEQRRIGALLQQEYESIHDSSTSDLKSRMEYYKRTSPAHLDNELHSIIATETSVISDELEAHYSQYFDDRQQVITLYQSYNDQFVQLDRSADALRQELERLSSDISAMTDQYNASIDTLNNDILTFNARAAGAYYRDEVSFTRDRDAITTRVEELEQFRASIDAKTDEYEQKRLDYNGQVDESNSLLQSLDSTLAPAPSL